MRHVRLPLLLLLQSCFAFAVEEEFVVSGPVALMAAGPQTVRLNTTLASLVALDDDLLDFCDLASHNPTSHDTIRAKIKGNVAMVVDPSIKGSCSFERAYLNLVEAGALGILLHAPDQKALVASGYFASTVGEDMLANLEATKSLVPMLEISDDARDDLKRRLAEHLRIAGNNNGGQQAARLIIESSKNPWLVLFNSNGWFVTMRRVVPSSYFLVAAASFYVLLQQASLGEFVWGSTSCWVIFIEMMPALALGTASIFGVYEGTFFSREAQSIFRSVLILSELASTILVARYWNAQAEAAKIGYEHARAVDPQRSWKSVVFTVAVLGVDVANAFLGGLNLVFVILIALLLTVACAVVFIRATLKMLGAARAPGTGIHSLAQIRPLGQTE
jgi:hypothetical protein